MPSETSRFRFLARYWPTLAMVVLMLLTGYDIYDRHRSITEFNSDDAKFIEVRDRTFTNEVVQLDNHRYSHCTFVNVTFEYEGTGYVQMSDITIAGSKWVKSDSRPVVTTIMFLKAIGAIPASVPLVKGPQHKPVDINPKMVPEPTEH